MNEDKIYNLEIEKIMPNRFQPRISFDEKAINELMESIKKHGIIQPIVVRKLGDKYEIIAGERRYKASVLAGLTKIPAIVNEFDDQKSAEIALIENIQRKDLTPIEEAISYKKILDMGETTQKELAAKLGKEQSTIANKLRLLNLHEDVQKKLLNGKISERHARSLLKLNMDDQIKMCDKIIAERLTVRKTDIEIEKILDQVKTTEPEAIVEESPEVIDFLDFDSFKIKDKKEEPSTLEQDINTEKRDNILNPGFIDVDKIENEAKDIFAEEKEKVDLEELLNKKEQEEEKIRSNKFFSYIPDAEEKAEEPNQDIYKDINLEQNNETKTNNEFDFDFSSFETNDKSSETLEKPDSKTEVNDFESSKEEPKPNFDFGFDFDFSSLDAQEPKKEEKVVSSNEDDIKTTIDSLRTNENVTIDEFDLGDMIQYIIKVKK